MKKNKHGIPILPSRIPPPKMWVEGEVTRLRPVVFSKCAGRCFYCGEPLALHDYTLPNYMTVDHYIPQTAGGPTRLDNLVPACNKCNLAKADMHPRQYREIAGPFFGEQPPK